MRALRILLRWPIRGWLHRRCLRRIALLERELFPIWQQPLIDSIEYAMRPGAVWRVNSHNDIQIFSRPNGDLLKKEWLEDGSALTTIVR